MEASMENETNIENETAVVTLNPHVTTEYPMEALVDVSEYVRIGTRYTAAHFALEVVVTGLPCMVGFVGNILALVVLRKEPRKGATVWLLAALAIADWLLLAYIFQEKVVTNFCRYMDYHQCYWKMRKPWPYTWPLGCMAQMSTVWLVVVVTIDRYVAICHPFKAVSWSTVAKAKRAIIVIVVCSVLFNIPRFFHTMITESNRDSTGHRKHKIRENTWALQPEDHTEISQPFSTSRLDDDKESRFNNSPMYLRRSPMVAEDVMEVIILPKEKPRVIETMVANYGYIGTNMWYRIIYYIGLTWLLVYMIPLVLLIGLNVRLMIAIRKARKLHAALTGNQKQSEKDNLAVTLNIVAVVTIFIVCQLPDFVLVVITYPDLNIDKANLAYYGSVCSVLLALNSSVNFAIYCLFYPKFRRIMIHVLCPVVLNEPESGSYRKASQPIPSTEV